MSVVDQLNAYITQVTTDISQETQPDTLDPNLIGDMGTDLADILKDYLPAQNRFSVGAGTAFPVGGNDTDMYFQYVAGSIQILRNILGAWTVLATIPISFVLPDSILVGLRVSVLNTTVTVTPGAWIINNIKYQTNTQTQFTLAAKDASFDRWDLIYADTHNSILILTGTPTLIPLKPAIPADCIEVDYIYIPAVGLPYALSNPITNFITPEPIAATGAFTLVWDAAKIAAFGVYGRFAVEIAGTYQDVPIKINKSLTTNKPISYDFDLSGMDALIHIL